MFTVDTNRRIPTHEDTPLEKSTATKSRLSHRHSFPVVIVATLSLVVHITEGSLKSPAVFIIEENRKQTPEHGIQNSTLLDSTPEKSSELTLEQLLQFYNIEEHRPSPKRKRSAVSQKVEAHDYCFIVSFQAANQMTEEIRKIINYNPTPEERFQIFEDILPENCAKAKVRLAKNIQNLGSLYLIVKRNATIVSEELEKLQLKYAQLEYNLEEIKQEASKKLQRKINEMMREKDILKIKLEKANEQLEENVNTKVEMLTALVMKQIAEGEYEKATETYVKLNPGEQGEYIYLIIKRAYREVKKFENIFYFIDELPWLLHHAMAYDALMTEVRNNYDLDSYRVLTLDYYVRRILDRKNEAAVIAESKPLLDKVKNSLQEPVARMISTIARKIQTESYKPIIEYATGKGTDNAFENRIRSIVEATYNGEEANADKLLDLANSLTKYQTVLIVQALLNKMLEGNGLTLPIALRMANKVKHVLDNHPRPNLLISIKNQFPQTIRSIIWDTVCIQSVGAAVFLIEEDRLNSDRVAIGLSKGKTGKYKWKLKSTDAKTFQIINANSSLFFYVDMVKDGVYFTREYDTEVEGGDWILEDKHWQNGIFKICSKPRNQYVATVDHSEWQIKSCT